MASPLIEYLQHRIRRDGAISFHDFMEEALYHPEFGYYSAERDPIGRQGDFYTAPDLDPIFGKLIAKRLSAMAQEMGVEGQSFTVLELGAGNGSLARDILREFTCRYRILERSAAMRRRQEQRLQGHDVEWIETLPSSLTGCVFSNEFFDALPVHRVVQRAGRLREIFVAEDFTEVEGDPQTGVDVPLHEGQLADINTEAPRWVRRIADCLERGYHLAIDYGYLEREFYARPGGTLMCYWRHQVSEDPYAHVGEQDITAHVNFTDLIRAGEASGLHTVSFSTQMDFLIELGILKELETLASSRASSDIERLLAVKKLILPGNMGERFKVLVQRKEQIAR